MKEIITSQSTASHFIPTKILLPIDFGASTYIALEAATDLAQRFHAELHLLNVVPMFQKATGTNFFRETALLQDARSRAEWQLAGYNATFVSRGVDAKSRIEVGNDVVGNILMVIARDHIDMIVGSTERRSKSGHSTRLTTSRAIEPKIIGCHPDMPWVESTSITPFRTSRWKLRRGAA